MFLNFRHTKLQRSKKKDFYLIKKKDCNLPEPGEDCLTSFSRPRILQMEKSVSDLLETSARTEGLCNSTRDLVPCADRTRQSTRAKTDLD